MPRTFNSPPANYAQDVAASSTAPKRPWKMVASKQPITEVNIIPLKQLVFEKFPKGTAIFDVITAEKDVLTPSEYVAKVDVWLKLLRRDKL